MFRVFLGFVVGLVCGCGCKVMRIVRQQRVREYGRMSVSMRMMRVMRARAVYDLCPPKNSKGFRKCINIFLLGAYRVI